MFYMGLWLSSISLSGVNYNISFFFFGTFIIRSFQVGNLWILNITCKIYLYNITNNCTNPTIATHGEMVGPLSLQFWGINCLIRSYQFLLKK